MTYLSIQTPVLMLKVYLVYQKSLEFDFFVIQSLKRKNITLRALPWLEQSEQNSLQSGQTISPS